jgi:hypothetical protein
LQDKFDGIYADAGSKQADMEEISNQILDLYERGAKASIRPALGKAVRSHANLRFACEM